MRIALVTHYYPPEVNAPAQRAVEHAKIWRQLGRTVNVITAQPSHPYGKVYEGFRNETNFQTENDISVTRLKTMLGANTGFVKRLLNYLSFLAAVIWNLKRIPKCDVVISTSPQFFCGLAGYFVARHQNIPWILEIRDVWPDSIVAVGAAKASIGTRMVGYLAKWAYSKADAVVSVSPGFNSHFSDYGVAKDKIELIPNGIDSTIQPTPCSFGEFPQLQHCEGKFIAAFIGTLGMAHGLDTLLDAAEKLKYRDDIVILLVGSGAEKNNVASKVAEKNLTNVIIVNQLPRIEILKLWSLVSVSIVHLRKNDVFKTVIPTKLLEAMSMGKPVILGVEGTALKILKDAEAGIAITPENSEQLLEALELLASHADLSQTFGRNGRQYVREHYDRERMAKKYLKIMDNKVAEGKDRTIPREINRDENTTNT